MKVAAADAQIIPTVFVVDDDVSVRESLDALIRPAGWQARYFRSADEFLAQAPLMNPGCVIVDPSLPRLDLAQLIASRAELPVIVVSWLRDVLLVVRAMRAGAIEFLTKPLDPEALLSAIREALSCSYRALVRDAELHLLRDRLGLLTGREREVLMLVIDGHLNKQIAGVLGISEYTVKAHRGQVMRKMEARSVADLVNMAIALHLSPRRVRPRGARHAVLLVQHAT
jgi:FixJ family two-component response regulator